MPTTAPPPCVLYEDPHLLVVHKPSGWNTHAPAPHAGEGIFDWMRHREPRWARLSILHRLDKETSGLLVFGKTPEANRSLSAQFTDHSLRKFYRFYTSNRPAASVWSLSSALVRVGNRYFDRPEHAGAEIAQTHFRLIGPRLVLGQEFWEIEAEPVTGKTHQIRVHAAASQCPIVGDTLYGGPPFSRVCLHARELRFTHPVTAEQVVFQCPESFENDAATQLRAAFILDTETNAFRTRHGAADALPGQYIDQLGPHFLVQSENSELPLPRFSSTTSLYQKNLRRDVRTTAAAECSPQHLQGPPAPERFLIRENAVHFELSLSEGYSYGLFLDQRDNRRRFLVNHIGAEFPLNPLADSLAGWSVLNTFAYTCAFSVCAALAGARTVSLDLSRKYLDWGRRNFTHNQIDPSTHEFNFGDCFDWLRRFQKKGRGFDVIVLDPPTFSRSKESGDFRAEHDYGRLVESALPLLNSGGILLASTNAQRLTPERFLEQIHLAVTQQRRRIVQELYIPQPPDFPITREEPGYLKTVWMRVNGA